MAPVVLTIIIIPARFANAIPLDSRSRQLGTDGLSTKRSERNCEKSHFINASMAACTTSRETPTSNAVNAS